MMKADKYIKFKDPVVEQICISKWSSDGIGLTPEDAANVTDIGTTFRGNTEITSFDEFKYFISVKSLGASFLGCTNLESIVLHENIIAFGEQTFDKCPNLVIEELDLKNVKRPLGYRTFAGVQIPVLKNIWHCLDNYLNAFEENNLLTEIDIPKGIESIWNFSNCNNLNKTNKLPISIKNIRSLFVETSISIDIELPNLLTAGVLAGGSTVKVIKTPITKVLNLGKITRLGDYTVPWNLDLIVYPYTLTELTATMGNRTLDRAIFHSITPPKIHAYQATNGRRLLYVPDESVELYKNASVWSGWSSRIYPISDCVEFEDITSFLQENVIYKTSLDVYELFDNTPISLVGAKSMIYDIDGHDTLRISGKGGSTYRLYCFIDENNETITVADENITAEPLYICIPSMTKKIIICCEESDIDIKVEIGKLIET